MDTPAGQKNITRALEALSPYLHSPRQTVLLIENCVTMATNLLYLQLILGRNRRRSGHWLVQGGLWLCYTFSFPLITYTIGQMVSSPIKNGLYPLWAVLLFWAAGCTDSVTVYALEESKQWKRHLFEMFQSVAYSAVIFSMLIAPTPDTSSSYFNRLRTSGLPLTLSLSFLAIALGYASFARVLAGWKVTNPSSSKVVADYMRDLVNRKVDRKETFDPITLKGYRYIVTYFHKPVIGKGATSYRNEFCTDDIVTINTIWDSEEFDDRLKDVCLSFALSRLLKRRFYGMECAEAHRPETLNFVIRGLLKQKDEENNYARAFHIIEVELGFLYDFFFTKYAVFSQLGVLYLVSTLLRLILISVCQEYVLRGSFTIKTSKPVIEVGTTKADVSTTLVSIRFLMLVEVLQFILYVVSDWATVSLACFYYTRTSDICRKLIGSIISCHGSFRSAGESITKFGKILQKETKVGKFIDILNLFGYWQNKMGQSSVIQGCLHVNPIGGPFKYLTDVWFSMIHSRKTFVVVPDLVKSEIVSCLQELSQKGGPLTNGKAALDRNTNFGEFDWTLSEANSSQTMIMLIWHIATEYCNIASSNEEDESDIASSNEEDESDPDRHVATNLSRYCAYLMSFIPLRKIRKMIPLSSSLEDESDIASSNEEDESDPDRHVATTLSRYCAYLMSFIPDLLPGNSTDTALVNHGVLLQGRKLLRGRKPISMEALLEAIHTSATCNNNVDTLEQRSTGNKNNEDVVAQDSTDNNNNDEVNNNEVPIEIGSNNEDTVAQDSTDSNNDEDNNIFIKGLKLGRALEDKGVDHWKILAEFWAETIIFIAPSDNVNAHMECLAQGGEFLTHIWALLNHAGILKRGQDIAHVVEDMVQP